MKVDIYKKKRDGTYAYNMECQGVTLTGSRCDGNVQYRVREALSFGQPFITHADLCKKHAEDLGFK